MTLAAQVHDHRASARGILFNNPTQLYITRWMYDSYGDIQFHRGAYHPIVWSGREYYIGCAQVSTDWDNFRSAQ